MWPVPPPTNLLQRLAGLPCVPQALGNRGRKGTRPDTSLGGREPFVSQPRGLLPGSRGSEFTLSPFPLTGSELSFAAILPSEDEFPASRHVGSGQQVRGVEHTSTQLRPSPSILRTGRQLRKDTLPVHVPSKSASARRACPSSGHSVWKVLQLGGGGKEAPTPGPTNPVSRIT